MMKRDSESVHDLLKVTLRVSSRAGIRPQVFWSLPSALSASNDNSHHVVIPELAPLHSHHVMYHDSPLESHLSDLPSVRSQ